MTWDTTWNCQSGRLTNEDSDDELLAFLDEEFEERISAVPPLSEDYSDVY